ncbi:hypothetical protein ACQKWADRAFT_292758 [Trichoderma austrokoningii]
MRRFDAPPVRQRPPTPAPNAGHVRDFAYGALLYLGLSTGNVTLRRGVKFLISLLALREMSYKHDITSLKRSRYFGLQGQLGSQTIWAILSPPPCRILFSSIRTLTCLTRENLRLAICDLLCRDWLEYSHTLDISRQPIAEQHSIPLITVKLIMKIFGITSQQNQRSCKKDFSSSNSLPPRRHIQSREHTLTTPDFHGPRLVSEAPHPSWDSR